MTKSEFTENLAGKLGEALGITVRRKQAAAVVEAVLGEITDALQRGEKVQLIPFGSFEVRKRKGRDGRNPRTGEKITIEERSVPVFSAGKALRDAVE